MNKKKLMLGAVVGVLEHDPNAKAEAAIDKTSSISAVSGEAMLPGDIVKIKQRDKTKSPYSVVQGLDHEHKQVLIKALDAPGNGNRKTRRNNYAKQRKG